MTAQIDRYSPIGLPEWEAIRHFVAPVVASITEGASASERSEFARALSQYVGWVHRVYAPDSLGSARSPHLIDYYTAHVRSGEVRANVAERERKRILAAFGMPAGRETRPHSTSAPATMPYSRREVARWRVWAANQHPTKSVGCIAVVALPAACGLQPAESRAARAQDITRDDNGGWIVTVGGKSARTVPALAGWEREMEVLASSGQGYLIPQCASRAGAAQLLGVVVGGASPQMSRLRSSWLVTHLNARTRTDVLLDAAGLSSADGLRRYIPYVDQISTRDRRDMLRLAGGAR